jgi:hypothetical protein
MTSRPPKASSTITSVVVLISLGKLFSDLPKLVTWFNTDHGVIPIVIKLHVISLTEITCCRSSGRMRLKTLGEPVLSILSTAADLFVRKCKISHVPKDENNWFPISDDHI